MFTRFMCTKCTFLANLIIHAVKYHYVMLIRLFDHGLRPLYKFMKLQY